MELGAPSLLKYKRTVHNTEEYSLLSPEGSLSIPEVLKFCACWGWLGGLAQNRTKKFSLHLLEHETQQKQSKTRKHRRGQRSFAETHLWYRQASLTITITILHHYDLGDKKEHLIITRGNRSGRSLVQGTGLTEGVDWNTVCHDVCDDDGDDNDDDDEEEG